MHQHARAANMPQELMTQTRATSRPLDEARDIRHDNGLTRRTADLHHTEVRLQCRERVVRNLRFGPRGTGEQCGLSGIWQPNQADIGDQAQLEPEPAFFARLTQLRNTGCLLYTSP